jgi:hypothetical protein
VTYRLFISHSAADGAVVESLQAHAEAIGFSTYLYERESEAGNSLSGKIQSAIRASDAVLALLTDATAASAYVHQEIGYALGLRKLVVPLVDRKLESPPLAMLQGTEYIPIDVAAPAEATAQLTQSLYRWRGAKDNQQLVMTVVLVALLVLLLWTQYRTSR